MGVRDVLDDGLDWRPRTLRAAWPDQTSATDPTLGTISAWEVSRDLVLVWAAPDDALERQFTDLADRWERETAAESFPHRRSMHPAYQRIIGMGEPAIGRILERLRHKPGHWFWALHAITGVDAGVGCTRISDARDAWLQWGVTHGHLDA